MNNELIKLKLELIRDILKKFKKYNCKFSYSKNILIVNNKIPVEDFIELRYQIKRYDANTQIWVNTDHRSSIFARR